MALTHKDFPTFNIATGATDKLRVYYTNNTWTYNFPHNDALGSLVEVEYSQLGLLDPDVREKLGVGPTLPEIAAYICDNRNDLPARITESIITLTEGNCGIDNYDVVSEWLATDGDYMQYIYMSNRLSRAQGGAATNSNGFYLFCDSPEEETEEDTFRETWLHNRYFSKMNPAGEGGAATAEDKWNKKYNYSFKMDTTEYDFFRTTRKSTEDIFFGLELELSTKLSTVELQKIVTDVSPKQEPFFIMKDDGSVNGAYNNKVEIVTVPCTPRYLRTAFKLFFQKINMLAEKRGIEVSSVFDVSTDLNNGIHIHIGRANFEAGPRGHHIKRFSSLFNLNDRTTRDLFTRVSRRPDLDGQYCAVSDRHSGRQLAWKIKNCLSDDTRGRLCLRTSATTEVRMYQGIFDIDHILTCIDFTEAMFDFAAVAPLSAVSRFFASHFEKFVHSSTKYRTLRKGVLA